MPYIVSCIYKQLVSHTNEEKFKLNLKGRKSILKECKFKLNIILEKNFSFLIHFYHHRRYRCPCGYFFKRQKLLVTAE